MFPSHSLTVENILSIGLVEVSDFLKSAGTLSLCRVRISSKASRRESAADSLMPLSHLSNSLSIWYASSYEFYSRAVLKRLWASFLYFLARWLWMFLSLWIVHLWCRSFLPKRSFKALIMTLPPSVIHMIPLERTSPLMSISDRRDSQISWFSVAPCQKPKACLRPSLSIHRATTKASPALLIVSMKMAKGVMEERSLSLNSASFLAVTSTMCRERDVGETPKA